MACLDLIGIVARDISALLRFYRLLGLTIPQDVEKESHIEITLSGGLRIAWDTLELIKSLYPDWAEPVGQRMSLAFKCDSPAEVDALHERIMQNGYRTHKAPWVAFWGQRYATVIDPDGNLVDLFAWK